MKNHYLLARIIGFILCCSVGDISRKVLVIAQCSIIVSIIGTHLFECMHELAGYSWQGLYNIVKSLVSMFTIEAPCNIADDDLEVVLKFAMQH